MKTILIAGGAGYIGSHMSAVLIREGYNVVIADNLSTGHKDAAKYGRLYIGDVCDSLFLDKLFECENIDGVIDFAACSLVGESCREPLKYYRNNLNGAQAILDAMRRHGVYKIVFSSTAAVYGEPEKQPIEETDKTEPANPYGESKLAIEKLLKWCDTAYGIKYAALRYFNAAGADNEADIGEDHRPETHLIPLVLQTALGKKPYIGIFGDDYPTTDGTCVRDYIDVRDLVHAHLLAYKYLNDRKQSGVFNLGNGSGFSVKQIIETAKAVTGRQIKLRNEPRRAGDPSALIASNAKAAAVLGWQPRHKDIADIIQSAWNWHRNHPDGYGQ